MIAGAHTLLYAEDAEAARAFFRDVLGFPSVDAGGGWLIFALPPAELGIHPVERPGHAKGRSELYLMCHDLEQTKAELEAKGVEFTGDILDTGVCHMAFFHDPDGNALMLHRRYAPRAG